MVVIPTDPSRSAKINDYHLCHFLTKSNKKLTQYITNEFCIFLSPHNIFLIRS